MASTFLDYEKVNNPLMASLLKEEFPTSVAKISSLGGTLLIPQAVAFDDPTRANKRFKITKEFIRDHTVIFDPKRPLNFVTLSGLLGKCITDDPNEKIPSGFYIFDRVSKDKLDSFIDQYNHVIIPGNERIFFDSTLTLFKDAEKIEESKRSVDYIMRSGVLVVGTKSIPFFIVPEILPPIRDNFIINPPSLDDSAVPIISSSFANPITNNTSNEDVKDGDVEEDGDKVKDDGDKVNNDENNNDKSDKINNGDVKDNGEEVNNEDNSNDNNDPEKEFIKQSKHISDFFQKLRLSDAVDIRNSLNR